MMPRPPEQKEKTTIKFHFAVINAKDIEPWTVMAMDIHDARRRLNLKDGDLVFVHLRQEGLENGVVLIDGKKANYSNLTKLPAIEMRLVAIKGVGNTAQDDLQPLLQGVPG